MLTTLVSARILPSLWSSSRSGQLCGSVRLAYRSVPKRFLGRHQTTNLGVRSSNLFGRASNSLILIQNFCAIFQPLTKEIAGAALGQHPQNFLVVAARLNP
jgi:hypothetical protein